MHYEPLNLDEIMALKESLEPAFSTQLLPLLISLNTNERLTQFLDLIDQRCLIHPEADGHIHLPDKKILVLGSSKVKDEHIYKTFEEQKISKHRVELHTEYEPSKINIDSLKYSLNTH